MLDCRVFILLATRDGEAYLAQLLTSIGSQSCRAWTLLARDDRSGDATPRILRTAAAADDRIVVIEDGFGRLGAVGNFGRLLDEARRRGGDYVFLADQDDVWHEDKVARQMEALQAANAAGGEEVPRMVFCDAAVVDAAGRPLHASFLRHNRLRYDSDRPLATLLGRSFVLGCASAANRALVELALPLPDSIASHDWWLALCAAVAGELICLDAPLLDYRRHGANASQAAIWNVLGNRGWRERWSIGLEHFRRSLDQARALEQRLRERKIAGGEQAELLERFCRAMENPSRWQRWRHLHRLDVPQIGWLRRLLYDVCVLTT